MNKDLFDENTIIKEQESKIAKLKEKIAKEEAILELMKK